MISTYLQISTYLDIYLHVVPGRAEPLEEEDHESWQLHRHEGRDQPTGHAERLWGGRNHPLIYYDLCGQVSQFFMEKDHAGAFSKYCKN